MIKTKKKNIHLPLVVIGYILFALLAVATLISVTVPYTVLLFNPKVLHVNVAVTLIAFTVGALLPVLLGYLIGDHAIKSKSKLNHHFTGVLFGLLAYWIMMLPVMFVVSPIDWMTSNHNAGLIIANTLPAVIVAVVACVLAIAHVKGRYAKQDIIAYRPFVVVLIAAILPLPLWSLLQNVLTNNIGIHTFVPLIVFAVASIIPYIGLRNIKMTRFNKLAWVAVSVSVLFFATFVLPQLVFSVTNYLIPMSTMEAQSVATIVAYVLAIILWGVYWSKQLKVLR